MKHRFLLYIREHHTGWFTSSVLTHPSYAAFGPHTSELRQEIAEVLEEELLRGTSSLGGDHSFEGYERRTINLELKAVQHELLVTVPMRFTLLVRPLGDKSRTFEVRVPRLDLHFRIVGEDNVGPWAEEMIRGAFHLKDVTTLLTHQYERSERFEPLEVRVSEKARAKKAGSKAAPRRLEPEPLPPPHPLSVYGTELVAEAKAGRLARASFRDPLVDVLSKVLCSKRNKAALLVGASGVGKTALVSELAHRITLQKAVPGLAGASVWSISGARFIAGAKFLGEWQARAQHIVTLIQSAGDVLYVGSLLELVSAETRGSGLSVAQFLLPLMQAGELCVLAEATPDAVSAAEAIDAPFVRAFQRIPVPRLPLEHTTAILERASERLAREHRLKYLPGTVSAALDVVARFGDAEELPGSGLTLLEEMVRLAPTAAAELAPSHAVRAFAQSSGFPEALLDPAARLDLPAIQAFFRERVIGQEPALELLCNVILLLKSGLNDPAKPLGSFLFMGPTGVGKTESALSLAEYLFGDKKRLSRFDLSEYAYPGSALRLVDGPGGQGELTRVVRERPFSVLLFDEVEKADPGVFDVLLQVLGEGRLTDGTGRTVRFGHTIVILTSNLGVARREPVGFAGPPGGRERDRRYLDAAARFFRPELLNRIDHVVPFDELSLATVRVIAARLLEAALDREGLSRRKIRVRPDAEVLEVLVKEGFDPKYGARPMKRAVEQLVTVPLAKLLMGWSDASGVELRLSVGEDGLRLTALP